MKQLKISPNLRLPIEAVTQTFAILAKRGAGKTYTASVLAEELLAVGQQIVAIDPTGAWSGLRSSADGKSAGFKVVVMGGDHGDLPLEEHSGEVVARAIVEHRFSAVLDLSLFRKGQAIRFMVAFAETLYRLNREPLHLFVDEADAVAPQGRNFGGDENRMLGAMEDIVRRGRKRGIGCTLITQRPAVLNKNVLTQCESLFALRLVHPRDINAVMEWINVHAEPDQAKAVIASLPTLETGEAWFWSPGWLGELRKVKIRQRTTFDSSATPKPGEVVRAPKKRAEVDLDSLGEAIKATVEKAKANDPAELRRRITDLEKQLQKVGQLAVDPEAIKQEALLIIRGEFTELFLSEFANADRRLIEAARICDDLRTRLDESWQRFSGMRVSNPPPAEQAKSHQRAIPTLKTVSVPASKNAKAEIEKSLGPSVEYEVISSSKAALGKAQFAILRAFYWLKDEEATDTKVCFYSGYSKSGHFNNMLGGLRSEGFVQGWAITEAGIAAIESRGVTPKPMGSELREWLRPKLPSAANTILDVLIEAYPKRLSSQEIASRSGFSVSGHFNNMLGRLRSIEAAEGFEREGGTKASDILVD